MPPKRVPPACEPYGMIPGQVWEHGKAVRYSIEPGQRLCYCCFECVSATVFCLTVSPNLVVCERCFDEIAEGTRIPAELEWTPATSSTPTPEPVERSRSRSRERH